MAAVFRHELSSWFSNLTAYIFGAFLLLFAGIYTMVYNIKSLLASFEYVPGNMGFVFIIVIPILTMRVIAEERRQKTDILLYSLPLSMTKVVLGKYAAMLVAFLVPMAVFSIYPLLLSSYGSLYLPGAFGSLVGFFFLGAALLAIGTFISSLTESQGIAAGICFLVMLLNFFLSSLADYVSTSASASFIAFTVLVVVIVAIVWLMTKSTIAAVGTGIILEVALILLYVTGVVSFEGLFGDVMTQLSLFERFYVFVDGVFDLTGIVYFLSVAAFFIFLTVQSLEKRRWSE